MNKTFDNEIEKFISKHEKILLFFEIDNQVKFPEKYINEKGLTVILVSYDMFHGYDLDAKGFTSTLFFGKNNEDECEVYIPLEAILMCKNENNDDIIFNTTLKGTMTRLFLETIATNEPLKLSIVKELDKKDGSLAHSKAIDESKLQKLYSVKKSNTNNVIHFQQKNTKEKKQLKSSIGKKSKTSNVVYLKAKKDN